MSEPLNYIRALNAAAKAWASGNLAEIASTEDAAYNAEKAFDAAGKRSRDYPGVQAAEKRYCDARAASPIEE